MPLEDRQLTFAAAALADAQQRAHAERLHLSFAQHLDLKAEAGQFAHTPGELRRVEDVGRL